MKRWLFLELPKFISKTWKVILVTITDCETPIMFFTCLIWCYVAHRHTSRYKTRLSFSCVCDLLFSSKGYRVADTCALLPFLPPWWRRGQAEYHFPCGCCCKKGTSVWYSGVLLTPPTGVKKPVTSVLLLQTIGALYLDIVRRIHQRSNFTVTSFSSPSWCYPCVLIRVVVHPHVSSS